MMRYLVLTILSLFALAALTTACNGGELISIRQATGQPPSQQTLTAPNPATAVHTPPPAPTAVPAPTDALSCPSGQRVELSVLVEPLDSGHVELPGSVIITTGGATPVCRDDQINVIARPTESYRFDHWEGDISGPRSTGAVVMTQSKVIRAVFVKAGTATQEPVAHHQITINGRAVQSGMIGLQGGSVAVSPLPPSGGQSPYPAGFQVTLVPRADDGFQAMSWSGDCGGTGPCQLLMNSDKSAQIAFEAINHDLITSANPAEGGSVTPPGTSQHPHMTGIIVQAQANEGFTFQGYTGDCTGAGSCSLVMTGPRSVTANFARVQRSLTVNVEPPAGGTVTPGGVNSYEHGAAQTVSQTAAPGYEFIGWTGDCAGTGICQVALDRDRSVTAVFAPTERTLSTLVSPSEGGTITPRGNTGRQHGESVSVTAQPATGYSFVEWSGDCTGAGSCVVVMDRDRRVTAVFEAVASHGSSDKAALIALYNATAGANWRNNYNWLSDAPVDDWYGVTTDGDGRVTELVLYDNRLVGEIPSELSNLTNLGELNLGLNQLRGGIPPELGGLFNLRWLELGDNQFIGEIPAQLGSLSDLGGLGLAGNQLIGEIPAQLSNLRNLEHFNLFHNQLIGEIPAQLGRLTNLELLQLSGNQLSGCIPEELRNVRENDLSRLGIPFCGQADTGTVSDKAALIDLYNATDGDNWIDNANWLSRRPISEWDGVITDDNGRVIELLLFDNQLSGQMPPELGNLSSLEYINLYGNRLSGEIPAELGRLTDLEQLWLEGNQLSGEIPGELGNLSSLEYMTLSGNRLSGEIPGQLGSLTNLKRLQLQGNRLSGEIPGQLGRLMNLEGLHLEENRLSGEIPGQLGNLGNLEYLSLRGNLLGGCIPVGLKDVPVNDLPSLGLPDCG